MSWFYLSLIAYFLGALSYLLSKIILSSKLKVNPFTYVFWNNVIGILVIFLIPFFNFKLPPTKIILFAFLAGILHVFGVLIFFKLLEKNLASVIVPFFGSLTPILVFILAHIFLNETLGSKQVFAFFLIVIGSFIIAFDNFLRNSILIFLKNLILMVFLASFFVASSQIFIKYVFNNTNFWNGFILRGVGGFLGALTIFPFFYNNFLKSKEKNFLILKSLIFKNITFVFLTQIISLLNFILINYAYFLGPVSLVNSLGGIQYVFLFILIFIFHKNYPHLLEEKITPRIIFLKILGIFLITLGIFLIFI